MTIDDKFRDEKLKYDINREPALSSGKIDKYECYRWRNNSSWPKKNDRVS